MPPYDAHGGRASSRRRARCIVGKLNMDEFAMGSSTENCAFGPTRNPWDLTRMPGGSSGGCAAAVAARLVPRRARHRHRRLDPPAGGALRRRGLKPTYGRVSRYGLVAFATSLDQVGPFAQRRRATRRCCSSAIAGHDPHDATSLDRAGARLRGGAATRGVEGLRVGVPARVLRRGRRPARSRLRCARAIAKLRGAGLRGARDLAAAHAATRSPTYYIVATAEASSNLARYDGVRYGLARQGARPARACTSSTRARGLRRRGEAPHHARHLRALAPATTTRTTCARRRSARSSAATSTTPSQTCDVLVAPTSPDAAFKLGEKVDDPLAMYLTTSTRSRRTSPGCPAMSVPCGFDDKGSAGRPAAHRHAVRRGDAAAPRRRLPSARARAAARSRRRR